MGSVTLSEKDRWTHIELLLHDDSIRFHSRIAGLFVLVYAQPLARVCRMRARPITVDEAGKVIATFDTFPSSSPSPSTGSC